MSAAKRTAGLVWLVALSALAMGAASFVERARLRPANPEYADQFGVAVALEGARALVGAENGDGAEADAGAVHVIERGASGDWVEVDRLTASVGSSGDDFGVAVALDGDRVLVGAPRADGPGPDSGEAYVFERGAGGAWAEVARLTGSREAEGDFFGLAVALDGDRAIVCAEFDDEVAEDAGAAYVFERGAGGVWAEVARLTASDGEAGDLFCSAASLEGDRAIVGAACADGVDVCAGAVYVFERGASGDWAEVAKLTGTSVRVHVHESFGEAVSLDGDRALVGAPCNSERDQCAGAAYVFERGASGDWVEVAKLIDERLHSVDAYFGNSVSLSGDRALVGANGDNDSPSGGGVALIFGREASGDWVEIDRVSGSFSRSGDQFGGSVWLDGARALIGSRNLPSVDSAAYVFELPGPRALDDAAATDEDTPLVLDALANDEVGAGAAVESVGAPDAGGAATINASGQIEYAPSPDFHGVETFEYTALESGLRDTATVTVTVAPVNDAPVARDAQLATPVGVALTLELDASDVEGDALSYTLGAPSNGALSGTAPQVVYTPSAGFDGTDSFTFTANDGTTDSNQATVTITVTGASNQPPVFVAPTPAGGAVLQGKDGEELAFTVAASDPDSGPMALVYEIVGAPAGAGFGEDSGEFRWTPSVEDARGIIEGAGSLELLVRASDGLATIERELSLELSYTDEDGDGVPDALEPGLGLDPTSIDTDRDGVPDGEELTDYFNPSDQDGDGVPDGVDEDSDGDGVDDGEDNCPADPNPEQEDADGDGIGSACDGSPGAVSPGGDEGCCATAPAAPRAPRAPLVVAALGLLGLARRRRG